MADPASPEAIEAAGRVIQTLLGGIRRHEEYTPGEDPYEVDPEAAQRAVNELETLADNPHPLDVRLVAAAARYLAELAFQVNMQSVLAAQEEGER